MSLPRPGVRFVLLLLGALVALGALAASARADERPFSLRYSSNVNGQIAVAANTAMQCPTNTVDPLMNSGCEGARAGTNARNNNSFDMQWLDIDSDASTFSSSSAELVLPAGVRVLFAGLYWTGLQRKGEVVTGANGFRGVPLDPPNAGAIGTVKVKAPRSGTYQQVNADTLDTAPIILNSGYGAFADVTALVGTAGTGTYTVADIQTGTGGNSFAGWSLVVAYSDPDEPLRNLSVFDGLQVVNSSGLVDIPLSGFKTPGSGAVRTTLGVVAAEGDAGATGDYLTLDDVRLADAVHPNNNTENSTIANRGSLVTTKSPNWANQLGYDSSLFAADGILANGATSAIFRAKTNLDAYAPQAITFATELFTPAVTFTKTESSGNVTPGSVRTYTLTATNTGSAPATGVILTDPIPAELTNPTVTAGTATIANGILTADFGTLAAVNGTASVTFTATVAGTAPLGEVVTNSATLDFFAADLGLPVSLVAENAFTVAYADPGVTKRLVSSSAPSYTYEINVTNQGTLGTSGNLSISDSIPGSTGTITAISAPGWTCASATAFPCDITQVVAPGAQYPPISVTVNYSSSPVGNTAYLAAPMDASKNGGQPTAAGSPAMLNDNAVVEVGQLPKAVLRLSKSALTGTISANSLGGFRIRVRNDGPSPATNTTITDTLPPGLALTFFSTDQGECTLGTGGISITCNLGTLAVDATATVVVRAQPSIGIAGTTVTNTATAVSDQTSTPVTASANLTIRPLADLAISKAVSTPTVAESGAVSYTLTAVNNGPFAASNMRVVDRLPAAVDPSGIASGDIVASDSGTCTGAGTATITCTWASVPSGATRTVTITGADIRNAAFFASDPSLRQAVNRANVYSGTDDVNQSDNADEATTIVTQAADLQVNATGPGSIAAGSTGQVSFTTVNNGPSVAVSPTLTIEIPAELTPVSAPAGCTIAGSTVTCVLGDLASAASVTTSVTVQAAAGVAEVSTQATASVQSSTPDFDEKNNTDITPFVMGPVADLVITKTAGAATVNAGGTMNWNLAITNNGPYSSNGSSVTDTLPAGLTPTSVSSSVPDACTISGQVVTCRAGEIVPDEGYQALIVTTVDPDYAGARITNTATLTPGTETDPNAANNTASATITVNPGATGADLAITKKASAKTVKPGGTLGYTMVVTNTGGSVSTTGTLTDTLPHGLTPTSARIGGTACGIRGRTVTCPVGFLPVGSSATATVSATVGKDRAGATLLNVARVTTGSEADPNARNNTARARTTVTAPRGRRAQLAITTRVNRATARPGQVVLVSARVTTLSAYPANTVRACISIPRGLAYRDSTGVRAGGVVCWVRPQVRKGTPVTVSYRAVARSAGMVTPLGTAVAGNAARVTDPASLPILGVTG